MLFVSYTFDITMAIFDVGNHIVTKAAGVITGNASIDVTATLQTMFNTQLSTMGIGELIGLGIETMIVFLFFIKFFFLFLSLFFYVGGEKYFPRPQAPLFIQRRCAGILGTRL